MTMTMTTTSVPPNRNNEHTEWKRPRVVTECRSD